MGIELYQLNEHAPIENGDGKCYQMMSYIIRADNGEIVLIDGGNVGDAEYLYRRLCEIGRNAPKVSAWFISHCHEDHVDAVVEMQRAHPGIVKFEKIYHNIPSRAEIEKFGEKGTVITYDKLFEYLNTVKDSVQIVEDGDAFTFGTVKIEVLFVPQHDCQNVNDTSVVYRMDAEEQSVLFLGDLCKNSEEAMLKAVDQQKLRCDFVQLAHHGQNGVSDEFYKKFPPKCALWCTPDWLWDNDFGDGFDTCGWKTVHTRQLMKELGVKKHIVSKDGEQKIVFPVDFSDKSWGKAEL